MPHPIDIHVGQRLKQKRVLQGMKQSDLAEAVGITFQQVQKYERGANRMGASRLYEFSKVLQVPVSYFFEGLETKKESPPNNYDMAEETTLFEHEVINGGREAMELMRSFQRLTDANLRKSVASLVKNMADGKPTIED